jgi:dolichol-phosphate mannosyltransferase
MGRLWVLLPCYNEEQALPTLLRQLGGLAETLQRGQGIQLSVIVVDDGSTDNTQKTASEFAATATPEVMPISIIVHERNLGLGAAMKSGMRYFLVNAGSDDSLVSMDADGTHPVETILLMLEAARAGSDVVIASRFVAGGKEFGLSKRRKLLSRICSTLMGALLPVRGVRDYSSGFRLYTFAVLSKVTAKFGDDFITEMGFASQAEILLKLCRIKARCAEVPLVLRYDLKTGPSKMRLRQTIGRYISLSTRELLHRNRPRTKENVNGPHC